MCNSTDISGIQSKNGISEISSMSNEEAKQVSLNATMDDLQNLKYLTCGGGSNVFTASFQENPVIIKVIKPEFQSEDTFKNEMETEIRILSRLNHPHIVKLLGAGYDSKGHRFIILERLNGGTMDKIFEGNLKVNGSLRKGNTKSLPLKDVVLNAQAIASAMDHFHSSIDGSTIIHRDLKPDNIGFTSGGVLKVMDFGLASTVENGSPDSDQTYDMTGGTGSLRYMAPEVADSRPYNHKADVYSFGILLWELLSCKKPYPGIGIDDYYDQVVYGGLRPQPIDQKWPKELIDLMEECWNASVENRPTSKDIVSKLESFKNGPNFIEQAAAGAAKTKTKRSIRSSIRGKSNLSKFL